MFFVWMKYILPHICRLPTHQHKSSIKKESVTIMDTISITQIADICAMYCIVQICRYSNHENFNINSRYFSFDFTHDMKESSFGENIPILALNVAHDSNLDSLNSQCSYIFPSRSNEILIIVIPSIHYFHCVQHDIFK